MKRSTAIYIGIAIIIVVGVVVLATNTKSSVPDTTTTASSAGIDTMTPGTSTVYTMADVVAHATSASCWATINGNVYDLTNWINKHPGGPDKIINLCGKDGTVPFNRQHGNDARPQQMLARFKIGTLSQ